MTTPILKTDRLLLRPIAAADTDAIFSCWMQDREVSRYMCWQASDDRRDAERFVQFELEHLQDDNWNRWMIVQQQTGALIGTCLVFFNDEENCWDVSYNLGRRFWGAGYASEAMKAALAYAAQTFAIQTCMAVHAVENPASGRVLQKLGFRYVKDVPYVCDGGRIHTTGKCYQLHLP